MAGQVLLTTLSSVGKHFSEWARTRAEVEAYGKAMADMLCAYLKDLMRDAG
jgi:hypothetical protein